MEATLKEDTCDYIKEAILQCLGSLARTEGDFDKALSYYNQASNEKLSVISLPSIEMQEKNEGNEGIDLCR